MSIRLDARAGLPFSMRIRVVDGKTMWPDLDGVEVQSQMRDFPKQTAKLVFDLTPFFTKSYEGNDLILSLDMTGDQTRPMKTGYFDVIVSDLGQADARAIPAAEGQIVVRPIVTSPPVLGG